MDETTPDDIFKLVRDQNIEYVDVGFCDGHGVFMSDSIDPVIYGQLMTSNHNKSNLKDAAGAASRRALNEIAGRPSHHKPQHVAEVVTRVGEQCERVGEETEDRFGRDKSGVQ